MRRCRASELWEVDAFFAAVRQGLSVKGAARLIGRPRTMVRHWMRRYGGMEMLNGSAGAAGAPFAGDGAGKGRLRIQDRVVIMLRLRDGHGYAQIARELGRDRSVVWREIKRNGGPGAYQADAAHIRACQKLARPKELALEHAPLREFVEAAMDEGWSPKLISLALPLEFPDDERMRISHETIYRHVYESVYVQGRGHLRQDLHRALSTGRTRRVTDGRGPGGRSASPYKDALKISDRPAEAQDRAVPGHWEADLIMSGGTANAAIGVLVERSTRYAVLLHLPEGHTAEHVAAAIVAGMRALPADLRRTLTYDRGAEMARYRDIEIALDLQVYFCNPHAPWQRGTNENTNRLLRHWFKKGSDLSVHTAEDLKRVQDSLNNRPRPTLGLDTPHHRLKQLIAQAQAA
jgi:IS30 family transposase